MALRFLRVVVAFGIFGSFPVHALPATEPKTTAGAYRLDPALECDGFPRVPVQTMKGACLGLVIDAGLSFPRKIVAIPGTEDLLVTDLGGWAPKNRGKVFRLVRETKNGRVSYRLKLLFQNLQLPHGLGIGPDGFAYVGEMGTLFKFDPNLEKPERIDVIKGLPTNLNSENMHPLMNFAFGRSSSDKGDLYINVGAPSDRCTTQKISNKVCEQSDGSPGFAQVRRFPYLGNGRWDSKFEVFARGLRNSMGLVSHPSGVLLQAENSRDMKEMMQPFEEINLLKKGKHYGWPYCFNFSGKSPEWPAWDCQSDRYEKPFLLMPPHAAPLDLLYYQGSLFPELRQSLVVSWHGYQPTGQRIVSYPVDPQGLPILDGKNMKFRVNSEQGLREVIGEPWGGSLRSASYTEVVSEWFPLPGIRPKGAPVGMAEAADGSLWIVDDKNKSILRLARSNQEIRIETNQDERARRAEAWVQAIMKSSSRKAAYEEVRREVFQTACQTCHSAFVANQKDLGNREAELRYLFSQTNWIVPGNAAKSLMLQRMKAQGGTLVMPPSGALPPGKIRLVENWISGLK